MTPTPDQIIAVLDHFAEHCDTRFSTYRKLRRYAATPNSWRKCYSLFQAIRNKTLRAEARDDRRLTHQYLFEEVCAKTLYNFSIAPDDMPFVVPAPFDADSAEFVFPIAVQFANYLGVPPPQCIPMDKFASQHAPPQTGG